ncbi:MAG: prepilin peptidase [Planctomycetaceae bacterium]|nr:prepilin peptidase [Planctomycetaceae bacterium]
MMSFFDLPRGFVLTCMFVLGCCFGSFLNVCIHRFPSKLRLRDQLKALNSHRSGCPRCAASIRWFDNIPLLGWLMLRGRCRSCRKPISFRYPFVECLTGILFVVMYWFEMPPERFRSLAGTGLFVSGGPQEITGLWRPDVWLHVRYAVHMCMICGLIVATFIDLELRIIPDGCTIPPMVFAILAAAVIGQTHIVPLWFQDVSTVRTVRSVLPEVVQPFMFEWDAADFSRHHPHLHGILVSLAGLIVGGGSVWAVRILGFWVLRQEAMGFGDVVLLGMVGSVIGWQPVLIVFFVAPMFAVFAAMTSWLARRDREIPYGPWLSIATLCVLFGWRWFWRIGKPVFDLGPLLLIVALVMGFSLIASLMLVQLVKRMLGIPLYPPAEGLEAGWTSADHLSYYNSERPDHQIGQWPRSEWPGIRAGQGLAPGHTWRHGGR